MSTPDPDIDPTTTRKWVRIEHPERLNLFERAQYENQRSSHSELMIISFLALQNQQIMSNQGMILAEIGKVLRKKGGSSAASSVASSEPEQSEVHGSRGGSRRSSHAQEKTPAELAMIELKGPTWIEDLSEIFESWIDATKKKIYVTRSVNAGSDANAFYDKLETDFMSLDEEHPILPLLETLNSDLKLDLYVTLGKIKKEKGKAAKTKQPGKVAKGKSVKAATDPSSIVDSQSSMSERDNRLAKRARFSSGYSSTSDIEPQPSKRARPSASTRRHGRQDDDNDNDNDDGEEEH